MKTPHTFHTRGPGRLRVALAVAVVCTLGLATAAHAESPIRECGNWYPGTGFTLEDEVGAGIWNITSRVASCATARRVIRRVNAHNCNQTFTRCWILGFACREIASAHEFSDMRCTAPGGRVVRWQSGS